METWEHRHPTVVSESVNYCILSMQFCTFVNHLFQAHNTQTDQTVKKIKQTVPPMHISKRNLVLRTAMHKPMSKHLTQTVDLVTKYPDNQHHQSKAPMDHFHSELQLASLFFPFKFLTSTKSLGRQAAQTRKHSRGQTVKALLHLVIHLHRISAMVET